MKKDDKEKKNKKNKKSIIKKAVRIFWKIYFICFGLFLLLIFLLEKGWIFEMPNIDDFENPSASLASQIFASDGTPLGKYYYEDRISITYKELNPTIIQALISTEDKRFYNHNGIDFESFARAVFYLGKQGGASTLTQQTAKNLFSENWNTKNKFLRIFQKFKEMIIAIKLERYFTKEEIITIYLNTVVFSENVFGIKNASRTFFQKDVNRLNVEEAAVLIGMINAPTLYNPRKNPKLSIERRNLVINRMIAQNYISPELGKIIKAKPIVLYYKKLDENNGLAPHFRMIVGEELKKWCKENKKSNGDNYNLYRDGLKIYTTINPILQSYAEEAVYKTISNLQRQFNNSSKIKDGSIWKNFTKSIFVGWMKQTERWTNGKDNDISDENLIKSFYEPVPMRIFAWNEFRYKDTVMSPLDSLKYHRLILQTGFVVCDPYSGEIKAWVGGVDFKKFKYDHVNIKTKRQVGSTIKPLLYSLALENYNFTPNTIVQDAQQIFDGYGPVPATTKSCSGEMITMAEALARSRNCATAFILKQINDQSNQGAKIFVEYLQKIGMNSNLRPYPSIALGSEDISLIEMLQAYTMFPGKGYNATPFFITRIEDRNGNILANFAPKRKSVISEKTAYSVVRMMEGVMKYGTGASIWSYDIKVNALAGKTGTTNNNSDLWFMGFTPEYLGGAWVGFDDRSFRITDQYLGQGAHAAMPIWASFFSKLYDNPNFNKNASSDFNKPAILENDIYIQYQGTPKLKDSTILEVSEDN